MQEEGAKVRDHHFETNEIEATSNRL